MPPELSTQQLLELYRQAQYLQVAGCAEVCVRRLGQLAEACGSPGAAEPLQDVDQAELGAFAAKCLFAEANVQHPVHSSPVGAELLAALKPALVLHRGDALAVLNTPALQEQFLQLSVAAVVALLESDDFGTDSESSVLLLLDTWIQASFGSTTAEERSELCGLVRLCQLNKPYLETVLLLRCCSHWQPGTRLRRGA
jgi:hypothetical protein